jgi:hypothetical protein
MAGQRRRPVFYIHLGFTPPHVEWAGVEEKAKLEVPHCWCNLLA